MTDSSLWTVYVNSNSFQLRLRLLCRIFPKGLQPVCISAWRTEVGIVHLKPNVDEDDVIAP
jgi:hypothetical protein